MSERAVCLLLLALSLAALAWDLVAVWLERWHWTVSAQVLLRARQEPIALFLAAFVLGILAGHWFWPQRD